MHYMILLLTLDLHEFVKSGNSGTSWKKKWFANPATFYNATATCEGRIFFFVSWSYAP